MKKSNRVSTIAVSSILVLIATLNTVPITYAAVDSGPFREAPAIISGDNVYITWWTNKSGNDEVMFKASTDGGKTFSSKMNLSDTPKSDSQDAEIAAAGNNVYITWWERNQTMNEPVMRISNDNGKTFGEMTTLSSK